VLSRGYCGSSLVLVKLAVESLTVVRVQSPKAYRELQDGVMLDNINTVSTSAQLIMGPGTLCTLTLVVQSVVCPCCAVCEVCLPCSFCSQTASKRNVQASAKPAKSRSIVHSPGGDKSRPNKVH